MSKDDKSWFAKHKVLTVILVVIVIAVIASVAGGGSDSNSSNNTGSGGGGSNNNAKQYRYNDRADKQSKDIELAVNETGTIDGVKMTVTSVEYKTSLGEFEDAESGKTYIVAAVQIENTSDRTKPYNPFDFRVQTAGGQVLDTTISTIPTLNAGDLVTGGKVSGNVVFEVPVETGHQYLIWKPGLDSERVIVELK